MNRFINAENQKTQDSLFSVEKGIVPIPFANRIDEVLTIYNDTTMGSCQLVSDRLIQEVNQKQTKKYNEADPTPDLENVKKTTSKEIYKNFRADFRNLIDDFGDMFSINQCDLGNCDATSHGLDVKPGSQLIKLPKRRKTVLYKGYLKAKIDAFMTKELITPCHNRYSAPTMLVPIKNGNLRLVIDYRKQNEKELGLLV